MKLQDFKDQFGLVENPDGGLMVPDRGARATASVEPARRVLEFQIPCTTVSETNMRESWRKRHRRRKDQRRRAGSIAADWINRLPPKPWRITLTRYGAQRMDPGNLSASMKGPQDGLCDAIGIDDGDATHEWDYRQKPDGRRDAYRGVGVKIETITPENHDVA